MPSEIETLKAMKESLAERRLSDKNLEEMKSFAVKTIDKAMVDELRAHCENIDIIPRI